MRAVGVHNFGGAFTRGVREAGWQVPLSLESSDFGVETQRLNNPGVEVLDSKNAWMRAIGGLDDVEMVYGNPACSCWSPLGRSSTRGRDQWWTDPNLQYTVDLVTVGNALRPEVWITESVPAFWHRGTAAYVARFWMNRGYDVALVAHDAKLFGVPQQRRRVFLVASTTTFDPVFPEFEGFVPAGQALEAVPYHDHERSKHRPKFDELLDNTRPGMGLLGALPKDWDGPRPRFMEGRVGWELPSRTIAGHDVYFHPHENRLLTWREAAALCGYPPDWEVVAANPGSAIAQLAKAVMVPVGRWVAEQAMASISGGQVVREPTAKVVVHWVTSQRIADFKITHREEPWTQPLEADVDWLERRVDETTGALLEAMYNPTFA